MNAALTKDQAIAIASRAHARDTRLRHQQSAIEAGLVRFATVSLSAAATGALKKHGVPNDIKGFPWKTGIVTVAKLGEALSKNRMAQAICGGVGDALTAIYVHDAVAAGSLVAGGGEL